MFQQDIMNAYRSEALPAPLKVVAPMRVMRTNLLCVLGFCIVTSWLMLAAVWLAV